MSNDLAFAIGVYVGVVAWLAGAWFGRRVADYLYGSDR